MGLPTPDLTNLFNQYPEARDAWNQHVQPQIDAENISGGSLSQLQNSFITELVGGPQGGGMLTQYGVYIDTAVDAAAQYVTMAHTAFGAVTQIEGLIDAVEAGGAAAVPQVVQTSMGLIAGVAAAIAPATMGIGSVIVAVVDALANVLGAAGLFGKPPDPSFTVAYCKDANWPSRPSQIIGCVGRFGSYVASATLATGAPNPGWVRFPVKQTDLLVAGDQPIRAFDPCAYDKNFRWIDIAFPGGPSNGQRGPAGNPTNADFEMPYKWISQIEWTNRGKPQNMIDFNLAFVQAWKANAESALNGQRAANDYNVLAQTAAAFNRAHESAGAGDIVIAPWKVAQNDPYAWNIETETRPIIGCLLPDLVRAGVGTAVKDSFGHTIPNAYIASDGQSLLIYGGPRKKKMVPTHKIISFQNISNTHGAFLAAQKAGSGKPSPSSAQLVAQLHSLGIHRVVVPSAHSKSLGSKVLPFLPALAGAASFPVTGPAGPVLGAAGTAAWYALRKHG